MLWRTDLLQSRWCFDYTFKTWWVFTGQFVPQERFFVCLISRISWAARDKCKHPSIFLRQLQSVFSHFVREGSCYGTLISNPTISPNNCKAPSCSQVIHSEVQGYSSAWSMKHFRFLRHTSFYINKLINVLNSHCPELNYRACSNIAKFE